MDTKSIIRCFRPSIFPLLIALTLCGDLYSLHPLRQLPLLAQELHDIKDSLERSEFIRLPEKSEKDWFKDNVNLEKLFSRSDFGTVLAKWGYRPLKSLKAGPIEPLKTRLFLSIKQLYQQEDEKRVSIQILVAHPRAAELISLGLVPEIAALEPPKLSVVAQEPIKNDNYIGTFYLHKNVKEEVTEEREIHTIESAANCSALFKLKGSTYVNVVAEPCSDRYLLEYAVRAIFMQRLENKLNS